MAPAVTSMSGVPDPRVAVLHYTAPPVIGGVEALLPQQARLLTDHGRAAALVAGRGEPFDARIPLRLDPLFDSRHPAVLAAQAELARGSAGDAFDQLTARMQAALTAALADCPVCLAHNIASLHKNLALTAALKRLSDAGAVRVVAWCHDLAWSDPLYAAELHAGEPWDLLRTPWPNALYVAISEARRRALCALLGLPPERVRVVPNGIDPLEFLGIGAAAAGWSRQFGWGRADPLMLLPARVTRRKNIELAIEITAALKSPGLAPQLVVMGPLGAHNPSNADYLRALRDLCGVRGVRDDVVFLQAHGAVGDAERRDLYAMADLLLFPSTQEGFGLPVLEGALARLPVFCADIPPLRETAGGLAHFFVLDEPVARIAARIRAFLETDPTSALRRRVRRTYDWEPIWRDAYAPLLTEAGT